MPPEGLSEQQWGALVDGVARGEYHLLLGAGASLGAYGGDGRPVPSAPTLAEEMLNDFRIPTNGERIALREAYEVIEGVEDSAGRDRSEYLKLRFSNCQPSWQSVLANTRWRRIWTLNIDDVVEQAYGQEPGLSCQVLTPYSWTRPYSEPDSGRNELQCIHLHGYAPELKPGEHDVVFSIVEYLQATSAHHAWHRVFGDEYLQRPFIVVGARLADEYDLAEYLRRGNRSWDLNGRPSVVVLAHLGSIQQRQLRAWGLIPVTMDAESFFAELVEEAHRAEAKLAGAIPGPPTDVLPSEARTFLQQFQWLRADGPLAVPEGHDLYQGDDPTWADIIEGRDARFEIVDRLLSDVPAQISGRPAEPQQIVHCLWGAAGSGKSVALLRIGRQLISRGFDVFSFRAEERLDTGSAFWWLQRAPGCALLFDGLADFSEDVGRLAEECSRANVGVTVFAAERERRVMRVYEDIRPDFLRAGDDHRTGLLSDRDIESLLDRLREQRRLGRITRRSREDQRLYFRRQASRQLFAGMAELEGGKGFGARVKDEYLRDIPGEGPRVAYALTSMSYALGYPLPVGIACVAGGMSARGLAQAVAPGGQLAGIVQMEPRGLRPRHRVVASLVVGRALDRADRFRLSQALVKALAPYITTASVRQHTVPYRIVRRLMDQEVVFDWVGVALARDWYTSLVPQYDWDARFWEQRALAEARLHSFPRARSFAEEGLRIQRHPFTLNTLGTVLVRMAVEHYVPGSTESSEVFWEGVDYLRQSRDFEDWRHTYPYMSFFTYALRFAEGAFKGAPVEERLSREWQIWVRHAERAPAFAHARYYEQLEAWRRRWLLLAVSDRRDARGES